MRRNDAIATLAVLLLASGPTGRSAAQETGLAPAHAESSPIVTQRLEAFRGDAARLAAKVDGDQRAADALNAERDGLAASLAASVVSIESRLQAGTTAGNPDLVAEWQRAQARLSSLDEAFAKLSQLSARLADSAGLADYLANSFHAAMNLPGATDADHQQLVALEAAANDAADHVRRLIDGVNRDLDVQAASLDAQHRNLVTLRHAVDIGAPLGNNLATMGRNGMGRP